MEVKDYKHLIGIRIKRLRNFMNLTQEAFCNLIELENSNLSNIENGKSYPSIQTLVKILVKFKIEPNDFLNFVDWKEEEVNPLDIEISEYLKPLSDNLKVHILEVLKNMQK